MVLSYISWIGGCATLPNVEELVRESPTAEENPPVIIAAHRELTPRESLAVIERLKRQTLPSDILERHLAVEEAVSGNPLVEGNKVTLLVDGPATYTAMFEAIRKATDHINLETFIFADDEAGRDFTKLLLQKAAEGVQVNLIYDSVGSIHTPAAFFNHLRHGGINVLQFNPINPLEALGRWRLFTHRDHRKILVVDGSIAFTGGVNISDVYSESFSGAFDGGKERPPWRDTDVRIKGPVVAEFQKLFLDTWKREKGPELAKRNYFPTLKREGDELVRVIGSSRGKNNRATYMTYVSAISFASDSIHLTSSYFVPDRQTKDALIDAAKRGVDVKIILPVKTD